MTARDGICIVPGSGDRTTTWYWSVYPVSGTGSIQEESVERRPLGITDLVLTRIGFGAWGVGGGGWWGGYGPQDDGDSIAAIHRALELGVNWIDTAADLRRRPLRGGRRPRDRRPRRAASGVHEVLAASGRGGRGRHRPARRLHPRGVRGVAAAARDRPDRPVHDPLAGARRRRVAGGGVVDARGAAAGGEDPPPRRLQLRRRAHRAGGGHRPARGAAAASTRCWPRRPSASCCPRRPPATSA